MNRIAVLSLVVFASFLAFSLFPKESEFEIDKERAINFATEDAKIVYGSNSDYKITYITKKENQWELDLLIKVRNKECKTVKRLYELLPIRFREEFISNSC